MGFSKGSSAGGGAPLYSPQSTLVSNSSANTAHQTPSTDNSSARQQTAAVLPAHQRPDFGPEQCISEIRKIGKDAQGRIQALTQAIGRQPGMPGSLQDLLNNDLRVIAQQFITTSYYCRLLEKKIEERAKANYQGHAAGRISHEAELGRYRAQLLNTQDRVRRLEQDIRENDLGHLNAEKRRKHELEKKAEKIQNQKRRIKEQQDQIDSLKKKLGDSGKTSRSSKFYDDSSSELEFPHSATSDFGGSRASPPFPEPKFTSTLDGKDEEFLLNNLKKMKNTDYNMPSGRYPPPTSGHSRAERDGPGRHGAPPAGPPAAPYGHFGHQMPPMMGPMGPMNPMNGALAPYGAFPPPGPYGPPVPNNYGRHGPTNGQLVPYQGHGTPGYPPVQFSQPRSGTQSSRGSESRHSNALVLRRDDDADFDPETKVWKELFTRLYTLVSGWTSTHCSKFAPGSAEEVTKNNPKLWEYILKVATCYKDTQAAPKHALFMLSSPEHRPFFVERLILQYVEQEMLHHKFWLGWDDETDVQVNKLGPVVEYVGYPVEQRRAARQQLRSIIEGIAKDEEYGRFRQFKTGEHGRRLNEIAGPFRGPDSATDATDAAVELVSIANLAMEISHKMLTSRLSFSFTWNECAVKFSHDSHIALNQDLHGLSLQHKHVRVMLVVTPSISYRDDNGVSIVPRGVHKAQVLVMS